MAATSDGYTDNLTLVIWVLVTHPCGQLLHLALLCLYHQQQFLVLVHLALPVVYRCQSLVCVQWLYRGTPAPCVANYTTNHSNVDTQHSKIPGTMLTHAASFDSTNPDAS